MAKEKRRPDELWTSYLIRRLQAEGLASREQDFEQTRYKTLDDRSGKLELQVSIYTPQSIVYIKRGLPALEETLRKCSTYARLREKVVDIDEEVHLVETGQWRGNLSLKFLQKGLVEVKHLSIISSWPFVQYQSGTTIKAGPVIGDLVDYIKSVGVERQIEDYETIGGSVVSMTR